MIINPYRIQPNEDWEIRAISIEVENLINDKIKLLLYLLERYLSNFYHGAEKYYKSSGSFNIFPFQEDIDNLKFNRFLYPKVDNLLKSKLRTTLEEIQELYLIEDINKIDSKNNYQFLAISPFLFEFRTWENLMSDILKKYYSKDSKHFRKKLGLLIDHNLKYLKIEKIWNLQEEYHFFLTDEEINRAHENNQFIDIIKDIGYDFELEKNIISYKYQKENSHSAIFIHSGEIYFKAIEQIKIEKRKLPSRKNFEIKLTIDQLNTLYDELEDHLNFLTQ